MFEINKDNSSEFPVNIINAGDGFIFKVAICRNDENASIEAIAGAFYLLFAELAKNAPPKTRNYV